MKILQALESKWAELKKFVAFHADIEPVDITEGGYWYNTLDRHLHVHTDKDDTIAYMEDVRRKTSGVSSFPAPTFTDNGSGSVTFTSCKARLYDNPNFEGDIYEFDIPEKTFQLTDGSDSLIVIDYNSGVPEYRLIQTSSYASYNLSDIIPVYRLWYAFGTVHSASQDSLGLGLSEKQALRTAQTSFYDRVANSGLILGLNAMNVTITDATVWAGPILNNVGAFDSANNSFSYLYKTSGGVWTQVATTTLPNTLYNPASGLATLDNNKFVSIYIYRTIGDVNEAFAVLDTVQYNTLLAAQDGTIRSDLPAVVTGHCMLTGRIIVQKDATTATVQSIFTSPFSSGGVSDHNLLSNLQGGDGAFFGHNSAVTQGYLDNAGTANGVALIDSDGFLGLDASKIKSTTTGVSVQDAITNIIPKNHASTTTEYGEGTTSLYGHVRKAQYMTIDGTDVVPSSLMYQNVVQRFHMAAGGAGTAGWLKVCSLTCVGGYTNEPITITLSRRGADKTCRLTMRFQSTNTLTPYVELANYEGQDYGVYYHKRVEGTYDIYVQKSEPYDRCNLTEFKSPYNIKLNSENGTVATVPEGSLAFSRAPSDYIKNGVVTTHNWDTFTEAGVFTVSNWSGANGPTVGGIAAYKWGQLVVEQWQNTVTQIYYPHQGAGAMPHYRQMWDGGGFSSWRTSPNLTEATIKRDITVSSSAGWYRLGYVDLAAGNYGRVFGSVRCFGRRVSADFNFTVTRLPSSNTLETAILADTSCNQISLQWEVLGDGTTIRLSYYIYSIYSNHAAFALYDLGVGGGAVLDHAYTHEYIGATKPANNELENCLDRVTLTDSTASSTLPTGDMTQPAAIQALRNNVKQLQSTTQNRSVTVSSSAGWYRLGYVDLPQYTNTSVFGEIYYSSTSSIGLFSFSVTRNNPQISLETQTFYSISNQPQPSVQWEVVANNAIRVSWYVYFDAYHSAFATYNIDTDASLVNAYTHEYLGTTKPPKAELVNCLDRVNLTDASASSTLPIGDMTQPTAIQGLRNNVKQLQSTARQNGRLTSQDWNTFTDVGIYNVAGWSGANGPTINGVQAYKWGFLVVESYQGTVIQTYYPHQTGMPCQRQSWEGGAFVSWSTSPRIGAGLNPNTSFVYQSFTLDRPNSNDIYFCV